MQDPHSIHACSLSHSLLLHIVDKNIAVSRLHWIVIDVANDQGQSAHSAEVLVVAYPDRNVVFLLLFPENLKCIFST